MMRRQSRSSGSGRSSAGIRILIAVVIGIFSIVSYLGSAEYNPVTGEQQYISLTTDQEIALGLQSAPELIQQYGGLHPDQSLQDYVDEVGFRLVNNSIAADSPWEWEFHLLRDPQTVNAFALPGGQVFITFALFERFSTEGQLAGVLGHEQGHVLARHSSQRIAQSELTNGLIGAVIVASDSQSAGQTAAVIGQLVNMQYGRGDEIQADTLGVIIMSDAGYDPRALIEVMRILDDAGGGQRQPEFFSTHPNPDNRIENIQSAIDEVFPNGVPDGLIP